MSAEKTLIDEEIDALPSEVRQLIAIAEGDEGPDGGRDEDSDQVVEQRDAHGAAERPKKGRGNMDRPAGRDRLSVWSAFREEVSSEIGDDRPHGRAQRTVMEQLAADADALSACLRAGRVEAATIQLGFMMEAAGKFVGEGLEDRRLGEAIRKIASVLLG